VPISLGWFSGGYDPPVINSTPFYWYAFALPERGMYRSHLSNAPGAASGASSPFGRLCATSCFRLQNVIDTWTQARE
jgi:hypothetical protein